MYWKGEAVVDRKGLEGRGSDWRGRDRIGEAVVDWRGQDRIGKEWTGSERL